MKKLNVGGVWSAWPPAKGDRPNIKASDGAESERWAKIKGAEGTTIGDWTVVYGPSLGMFVANREGFIPDLEIKIAGKVSDGTVRIIRMRESDLVEEVNWLTGGTDPDGNPELLMPEWLPLMSGTYGSRGEVGNFHDGYATVSGYPATRGDDSLPISNSIRKDGSLLFSKEDGIANVSEFTNGFARVRKEGGNSSMNWVGTDGKMLSDEWFYEVHDFHAVAGFAMAGRVDSAGRTTYNFIGTDGKFAFDKWLDDAADFMKKRGEGAWVKVYRRGWNIFTGIRRDGTPEYANRKWLPSCVVDIQAETNGMTAVKNYYGDNGWTFLDGDMKPITRMTFKDVDGFIWDTGAGVWAVVTGCIADADGNKAERGSSQDNLLAQDGSLFYNPRGNEAWPTVQMRMKGKKVNGVRADINYYGYFFAAGPDYVGGISPIGLSSSNVMVSPPLDSRISCVKAFDRITGTDGSVFLVMDSKYNEHIICSSEAEINKDLRFCK